MYLEAGVEPLFFFTLALHFKYLQKVASMPAGRYPRVVAVETADRCVFWSKTPMRLYEKHACAYDLTFEHSGVLRSCLDALQQRIRES